MAKSLYENTSNKDLVASAVERKLTVETAVIWDGEELKTPSREALITMLEKHDTENANNNPPEVDKDIYSVNPKILEMPTGYSGTIDGASIMVVPHLYGEGFDTHNQKVRVITENGFVLVNGEKTESGKFEKLSDKQLRELVSAGVIKLTSEQEKAFRLKFYGIKDKK